MRNKRILHIALGRENPEMADALLSLGGYRCIDWTSSPNINTDLIEICAEFEPDLIFMQLQGSGVISLDTIKYIHSTFNAITVNWTGDVREDIEWFKEYAPYFTHTLFTNKTDVESLRAEGLRSDFLQVGFQDRIYKKEGEFASCPDIVFMANNYTNRFPMSQYRKDIADLLKISYPDSFGLFGTGWGPHIKNYNSLPNHEAAMYRSAKIGISISHFDYERYHSDRHLRIMACGCFCLSYHYKGIERDFKIGEHLDTFKSEKELKDKIDYYLKNDEVRNRIAAAGQKYVWDNCRWQNRIDELKKIIGW